MEYTVKQGDCLSSIAKQFGFSDFRTIYNHARNTDFRQKRPNPNVIFPGDQLHIPDKRADEVVIVSGNDHQFQLKTRATLLRIVIKNSKGVPQSSKRFRLTVNDSAFEGLTDGDGLIQHPIPADADRGSLIVFFDESNPLNFGVWPLHIGHLDPENTPKGAQARLNNLGFFCGEVDGIVGPKTLAALNAYQRDRGLPETDRIDTATCKQLEKDHEGA